MLIAEENTLENFSSSLMLRLKLIESRVAKILTYMQHASISLPIVHVRSIEELFLSVGSKGDRTHVRLFILLFCLFFR